MGLFVRKVRTRSGATAVQIAPYQAGRPNNLGAHRLGPRRCRPRRARADREVQDRGRAGSLRPRRAHPRERSPHTVDERSPVIVASRAQILWDAPGPASRRSFVPSDLCVRHHRHRRPETRCSHTARRRGPSNPRLTQTENYALMWHESGQVPRLGCHTDSPTTAPMSDIDRGQQRLLGMPPDSSAGWQYRRGSRFISALRTRTKTRVLSEPVVDPEGDGKRCGIAHD